MFKETAERQKLLKSPDLSYDAAQVWLPACLLGTLRSMPWLVCKLRHARALMRAPISLKTFESITEMVSLSVLMRIKLGLRVEFACLPSTAVFEIESPEIAGSMKECAPAGDGPAASVRNRQA